jgi:hypothetical protein
MGGNCDEEAVRKRMGPDLVQCAVARSRVYVIFSSNGTEAIPVPHGQAQHVSYNVSYFACSGGVVVLVPVDLLASRPFMKLRDSYNCTWLYGHLYHSMASNLTPGGLNCKRPLKASLWYIMQTRGTCWSCYACTCAHSFMVLTTRPHLVLVRELCPETKFP